VTGRETERRRDGEKERGTEEPMDATGKELYKEYNEIIGMLVNMSRNNVDWRLP
jgi:hypothetical protein